MSSKKAAMPGVFKYRKMIELAKKKNLGSSAIAERVGANQGTVNRWAKGVAVPSPTFIRRLADVLEVEPSELYKVAPKDQGLAYYRVLAGYSLAQLAPLVDISPVHLGRMETGNSAIPPRVCEALCTHLNIDAETIERAVRLQRPKLSGPVPVEIVRTDSLTDLVGA